MASLKRERNKGVQFGGYDMKLVLNRAQGTGIVQQPWSRYGPIYYCYGSNLFCMMVWSIAGPWDLFLGDRSLFQLTSGLQPFPSLHHEILVKSPVWQGWGWCYCLNNLTMWENLFAFQEGHSLRWPLWVTPFWGQGRVAGEHGMRFRGNIRTWTWQPLLHEKHLKGKWCLFRWWNLI